MALPSAPQKMWNALYISFGLLGVTSHSFPKYLCAAASFLPEVRAGGLSASRPSLSPVEEREWAFGQDAADESSYAAESSPPTTQGVSACLSSPSLDPELRRICMLTMDLVPALYRRLSVEYEIVQPLSAEEALSAISEGLKEILEEEDYVADLVIAKKLPHGALPVRSLKQAIEAKLSALHRLKPKNITTKPGLMGLQIRDGKVEGVMDCVAAQVTFFHDLMGAKFTLARMTPAEVAELADRVSDAFSGAVLEEGDLPVVLEFTSRAVMDAVAAPSRAESLGAALQAMPPFSPVGDDNGLAPLSPSRCLTLVRGLFPTLRAHMTLHYEMKDPTEEQLQAMADVLLPIVNAHRSRLRLSAQKGVTLLAPEEHTILWGYMEQYAREHKLVGRERPLNLWRFPHPAGAANLLD